MAIQGISSGVVGAEALESLVKNDQNPGDKSEKKTGKSEKTDEIVGVGKAFEMFNKSVDDAKSQVQSQVEATKNINVQVQSMKDTVQGPEGPVASKVPSENIEDQNQPANPFNT